MKLCCTAVLMVLLVGCGTASRVVRLDTGQTDTLVFTPRSGAEPVALGNGEFQEAVSDLARDVRPPTRPQEAARRLLEVEARSGSYTYETRSRRITPHELGAHLEGESTEAELELTRDYLRWCERTGRPGDCLRLLTESPTVNGDGRFALALALAKGAVLDEMLEAFKDMADPHAAGAGREGAEVARLDAGGRTSRDAGGHPARGGGGSGVGRRECRVRHHRPGAGRGGDGGLQWTNPTRPAESRRGARWRHSQAGRGCESSHSGGTQIHRYRNGKHRARIWR